MSKLIALKSGSYELLNDAWNNDFSSLKQQSLLFDQIGIFRLGQFNETLENSSSLFKKLIPNTTSKIETIINELQWLQQEGIVFELLIQEEFQVRSTANSATTVPLDKLEEAKILFKNLIEIQKSIPVSVNNEPNKVSLFKKQHFTVLRLMSIFMGITKGITAVTTFPYTEYTYDLPNSNKSDVAHIVINNLPIPNNETPWEQIIDYRNDPDTQKHLASLRRWISKISKENLSSIEIEEEIRSLVDDFQNHMKFHKMKANTEALEVLVNASADVIGNLLTLKFSKIISPLFAIKKRELSLLEAELTAPGREMAYIIKTKETFNSQE